MKYRIVFFIISLIFLIPGIVSLLLWGLKPAIDFTGGSLLEIESSVLSHDMVKVEEGVGDFFEDFSVQFASNNQVIIKGNQIDDAVKQQLLAKLSQTDADLKEIRFETVGPILGKELLTKTLVAILLVAGIITFYVAWRFKDLKYGVCAILAMFHDSLILLGSFSLLGHFFGVDVDVLFVTALLTTLSFSIHDTIVVFDRIREKSKQISGKYSYVELVNVAVIETLGRSINNSITIIIMLLSLTLLGGVTIRWFSLALLIGAITGTYSSTFTAAPLLLVWDDLNLRLKK